MVGDESEDLPFAIVRSRLRKKEMVKRICQIFMCLCAPFAVMAQQMAVADSLVLEDVAVWGSSKRHEIVPSQRLSGKQLEALGNLSVADAVRYFSGVQIKDYGGVGGLRTVDVRSMGTNHLGVFYDGVQLDNAQNGQVDLGKFSMDDVESISLYNGQKSDILQSAKDFAASGSIYIRTRRPRFEEGKVCNVLGGLKAGSFGVVSPSVRWEQKLSEKVSSALSAEYLHADGRYKFRYRKVLQSGKTAWDTTAMRQNGDVESVRVEGGLFGSLTEGYWNAKLYYYASDKGIPGAIVNNVWKGSQRQWDRNVFAQGSMKHRWGRYELLLNGKYAIDYLHYLNPDTTSLYIDNEFTQREAYVSVANSFAITERWDVALSTDYQYNTLSANLRGFTRPQRHTLMYAVATTYELWRIRLMGSLLGTYVDDVEKGRHEFSPSVFLSLYPFSRKDFCLRAFYKKAFRMPTFNDLYYTDIGSISLEPERAQQYNVGFCYTHHWAGSLVRSVELKADGYYNRVDNKIVAIPKGSGQYRWMMMNIGKVKIRGVDVSGQAELCPWRGWTLGLTLNYTYQRAQDMTDPADNDAWGGTYGGQIAYIPWHSGSAIVSLSHRGWNLNYSFIYIGERYHTSANIPANHEEPWYTHDLSLMKDFTIGGVRMSATVECDNVLNQQYDVIANYPMPGRNWRCTLKVCL